MLDFTPGIFSTFLDVLITHDYQFARFDDYLFMKNTSGDSKVILLRHDVDDLSINSLEFARIESEKGIKGTFNFRIVPESFDESIIEEIYSLGHEIGYHYEDLGVTAQRLTGTTAEEKLVELAMLSFKENLEKLRQLVPVKTICMHGSPMSRWDSRLLWKYFDYHDLVITGEPYFDIDFDEVLYLTDTGRRWDGDSVSIRDKAQGSGLRAQGQNSFEDWKVKPLKYRKILTPSPSQEGNHIQEQTTSNQLPIAIGTATFTRFHSTSDIIKAVLDNQLPNKIMMTFHPQRWTDRPLPWVKELVWQNMKNVGKYFLVRMNERQKAEG